MLDGRRGARILHNFVSFWIGLGHFSSSTKWVFCSGAIQIWEKKVIVCFPSANNKHKQMKNRIRNEGGNFVSAWKIELHAHKQCTSRMETIKTTSHYPVLGKKKRKELEYAASIADRQAIENRLHAFCRIEDRRDSHLILFCRMVCIYTTRHSATNWKMNSPAP